MQQCTDAQTQLQVAPSRAERQSSRDDPSKIRYDRGPHARLRGASAGRADTALSLWCREQAKTRRTIGRCACRSVRAADRRRRSVLAKPSAERASPMRDTATRRRSNIDTYGYTPTPKEKSETTKPEHHRQDRPPASPSPAPMSFRAQRGTSPLRLRKGARGMHILSANPPADQQHAPIGLRAHVIPAKAGIQRGWEMGESPLREA